MQTIRDFNYRCTQKSLLIFVLIFLCTMILLVRNHYTAGDVKSYQVVSRQSEEVGQGKGRHINKLQPKSTENSSHSSKPHLQVVYKDLSKCPPRPQYFPELKGHCWGICKPKQKCNQSPTYKDVHKKRADISCFANMQLIGVRKSGTSDFSKWKRYRDDIVMKTLDYRFRDSKICPVEYFSSILPFTDVPELKKGIYVDGPGNLGMNRKVSRNNTHLIIMTALQYIGYMVVPETKLYLQIRNPTDRTISNLFHWHNNRGSFSNITHKEMDAKMVDSIIQGYLNKLKNCIAEYGELYCVYLSDGRGGQTDGLLAHSMYVVYLEEAFKFIPRENIMIRTYEEYSKRTDDLVKELDHDYFKIPFKEIPAKLVEKVKHKGRKNPVWSSTLQLLDEFYEPYNRRLADLLGDDKWLFPAQRTQ